MQVTKREAAAFNGEPETNGQYAIAFGMDRNCHSYCTLPVCAFPLPGRHIPTELELVAEAERAALSALFNEKLGYWPHMLARDPGPDA